MSSTRLMHLAWAASLVAGACVAAPPAKPAPTAATAAASAASATDTAAGDRLALVIGNSAYETFDPLVNPAHDAQAMCDKLGHVGFQTQCVTNLRNREDFMKQVREFAGRVRRADRPKTVFFYAGHAVQVGGENYLVPTGAELRGPKDIEAQFVGMNAVFAALGPSVDRFQMVVLDACRNNPFQPRTVGRAEARAVAPAQQRSRAALVRALGASQANYGLSAIKDAPTGTIVLYATAADDAAFDGIDGHGPLTKHLLAHIDTPGINVEEMIKRVTTGVQNETLQDYRKRQTPFVYSSFTGSFCFAGCARLVDQSELERAEREKAQLNKQLEEEKRQGGVKKSPVFVTPTF
ncbi:MAG: hypothetical protein RI907_1811 [Pseudomonadota bacterium]